MEEDDLIACHECDTLFHKRALPVRTSAKCTRCGATLYPSVASNLDKLCAITLAALITFLIAQAFPIVELETNGITSQTTLIGAIVALWGENMEVIAVMVFCATILFPLTELVAMLYLMVALRAGFVPAGFSQVLRAIQFVRPWGMIEVFMLGVLVTLVKMVSIARRDPRGRAICVRRADAAVRSDPDLRSTRALGNRRAPGEARASTIHPVRRPSVRHGC